jgi:endonuclease-3 related protein
LSLINKREEIRKYYAALYRAWGAQHWWPAKTPFEVIVGAYLTQNTAWNNVERALASLSRANLLSLEGIRKVRVSQLERLIRPSGYFRQKAKRLKLFVKFLDQHYNGSLDQLFSQPANRLREQLLELNGIGPETADSILLYAGNHPVFVVDAYTRRILVRHEILPETAGYEDIRSLFQEALQSVGELEQNGRIDESSQPESRPKSGSPVAHKPSAVSSAKRTALVQVFNDMHGLMVGVGKHYCKKSQPQCDGCPLQPFLPSIK